MNHRICPVDVISWFDAQGRIHPLRIRLQDEGECYRRIDIERVLRTDKKCLIGAEAQFFLCSAMVEGSPWLFELKYSLRSHRWSITGRTY